MTDIHYRPFGRATRGEMYKLGLRRDVDGLLDLLNEPEVKSSQKLLEHLLSELMRQEPHPAVVPALAPLRDHPENTVRMFVARALGATRSEAAVPLLLDALRDPDSGVRMNAIKALAGPHGRPAIPALVDRMERGVRFEPSTAAETLGLIGDSAALPDLIKAVTERRTVVRWRAAEALRRIGDERAIEPLQRSARRSWPPWRGMIRKEANLFAAQHGR